MRAEKKGRDRADPQQQLEETEELVGGGMGAASALERMKAEHALRHQRQHGARTPQPAGEEDPPPEN